MIELLIQILRFAAESPQNALVVIGFFGAFVMFAPKIPPPKASETKSETPRNAKGRKARTARKNRAVVKKDLITQKRKKEKPKGWFVPPTLSPWQDALLTQYRVGRDFTFQN